MHMKNRAFVPTYTIRMKSMESFINEAPDNSKTCVHKLRPDMRFVRSHHSCHIDQSKFCVETTVCPVFCHTFVS